MTDLRNFGQRTTQMAKELESRLNSNIKALAGQLVTQLVLATPVDTGHARSNWVAGVSAPFTEEVPGAVGSDTTIQSAKDEVAQREPGQSIYITNNVPYIQRLNEGWSSQAPAGFVQRAVQRALSQFTGLK